MYEMRNYFAPARLFGRVFFWYAVLPAPRLQIPPDAAPIEPRQPVIRLAVQIAGGLASVKGLEHPEVFGGIPVDSAV